MTGVETGKESHGPSEARPAIFPSPPPGMNLPRRSVWHAKQFAKNVLAAGVQDMKGMRGSLTREIALASDQKSLALAKRRSWDRKLFLLILVIALMAALIYDGPDNEIRSAISGLLDHMQEAFGRR